MVAYSSLSAVTDMKCPGAVTTALNPGVTSDSLNRVNWLLNTYYNPLAGINPQCFLPVPVPAGSYQSRTSTTQGLKNPATKEDVQRAVWTLLGEGPERLGSEWRQPCSCLTCSAPLRQQHAWTPGWPTAFCCTNP